ncbi:inositol-3-phosphate synthase [Halopelagius longus]|uniref:Myo-inositol-1-phosphate synthase n=1 Tax=Halopelagius longus TaxID=1236180 RepID=A0A1H1GRX4_9EURY|nr:inositol-3-phosphate synthase [Halopelagius longus]RDI69515.1 myo-inositol-1-phosphate synthase [Halopelagius longus]SDR15972.1 myo-inositol-1-phosphate synthase [Halopelagius longus]
MSKTGVWIVGARGNVATTAIVGARAIAHGEADTTGMVTAREPCSRLDLPSVERLIFGGHDIRRTSVLETARTLSENGIPSRETVDAVREDLEAVDERIEVGTAVNCGNAVTDLADETLREPSVEDVVEQIRSDYRSFARENDLDRIVVVNAASSEPPLSNPERYDTLSAFEGAMADDDSDLPASSLYAYAALVDGRPYVNFTPSTGSALGGLVELADKNGVPHMGRDAKTGETLVKSALAPMFASRNLRVRSWEGHNILGNADGEVLEDEENEAGKLETKGGVLEGILDGDFHNRVRIDYAPPLADWKTAWDDIRFDGFLGTRMKMQFTWEGSDSALAAPLVLDLVRLVAFADERGESGLQPQLASFFKQPLGVDEHDLSLQFDRLREYANSHTGE